MRLPPNSAGKSPRIILGTVSSSNPGDSVLDGDKVCITGKTVLIFSALLGERDIFEGGRVIVSSKIFLTPLELSWISDEFCSELLSSGSGWKIGVVSVGGSAVISGKYVVISIFWVVVVVLRVVAGGEAVEVVVEITAVVMMSASSEKQNRTINYKAIDSTTDDTIKIIYNQTVAHLR